VVFSYDSYLGNYLTLISYLLKSYVAVLNNKRMNCMLGFLSQFKKQN